MKEFKRGEVYKHKNNGYYVLCTIDSSVAFTIFDGVIIDSEDKSMIGTYEKDWGKLCFKPKKSELVKAQKKINKAFKPAKFKKGKVYEYGEFLVVCTGNNKKDPDLFEGVVIEHEHYGPGVWINTWAKLCFTLKK